jgi:hypothetical protein
MAGSVKRTTVDLSGYPDLVVVYLGMRVNLLSGLKTLFGFGPKIQSALRSRHTRGLCVRRVERSLPHRQRARRHVLHRSKHSRSFRDRQGVGHFKAFEGVSLCSCRRGESDGRRLNSHIFIY